MRRTQPSQNRICTMLPSRVMFVWMLWIIWDLQISILRIVYCKFHITSSMFLKSTDPYSSRTALNSSSPMYWNPSLSDQLRILWQNPLCCNIELLYHFHQVGIIDVVNRPDLSHPSWHFRPQGFHRCIPWSTLPSISFQ